MHKKGPLTLAFLALVGDYAAVSAGLCLAFWVRFASGWFAAPLGVPSFELYRPALLLAALGWTAIYVSYGLYDPARGLRRQDEILLVLKGTFFAALFLMAAGFLYREVSFSRLYFALATPLGFGSVITMRMFQRRLRKILRRRGLGVQRILLVGSGSLGRAVRERIDRNPDFGYELTGVVTENGGDTDEGHAALGAWADLPSIVTKSEIDRIFIALANAPEEAVARIVRSCQHLPVQFEVVPDLFGRMNERMRLSEMDGIPLLGVKGFPLESWNRFMKRTFDIVMAAALLAVFAPIGLLIALLIRLDSRGPILYAQVRIGRDGRIFRIQKFRSMRQGAEVSTGPVWSSPGDSRTTRIGSILRRTSLDELPQLWNVLKGDMSLVGPRPERPHFVRQFGERIPRYFDRHRVKSGMTGWAQVNGLRGNTSVEERTRFDVFYVENWSLFFDVKILLLTLRHVVKHAAESK